MSEENNTQDDDQWEVGEAIAQAGHDIGRGLWALGWWLCIGLVCHGFFAGRGL